MSTGISLLTKEQKAVQLNISVRTLDRLIKAGNIAYLKVGKQIRFNPNEPLIENNEKEIKPSSEQSS